MILVYYYPILSYPTYPTPIQLLYPPLSYPILPNNPPSYPTTSPPPHPRIPPQKKVKDANAHDRNRWYRSLILTFFQNTNKTSSLRQRVAGIRGKTRGGIQHASESVAPSGTKRRKKKARKNVQCNEESERIAIHFHPRSKERGGKNFLRVCFQDHALSALHVPTRHPSSSDYPPTLPSHPLPLPLPISPPHCPPHCPPPFHPPTPPIKTHPPNSLIPSILACNSVSKKL